jgi:hypothetical protein
MDSEKKNAIESLIQVFGKEFPRRNHVILVDMSTGSYRVDEMLSQEIVEGPRNKINRDIEDIKIHG